MPAQTGRARKPVAKPQAKPTVSNNNTVAAKPDAKPAKEDGEICRICWPAGWPASDSYAAGCEHGTYAR